MITIKEQEAQDLANKWGAFLSVDKNGEVWWSESKPEPNGKDMWGNSNQDSNCGELPIRIESEKIWSEQLYTPAIVGCSVTKQKTEMHHDNRHYSFVDIQTDTHTVNAFCQLCGKVVKWERLRLTNDVPDTTTQGTT